MIEMTTKNIKDWMFLWVKELIANKTYLNELDAPIGDSDHGTNMERGAKAIQEVLADNFNDPQELTRRVAMTLLTKVGGASGVIYGTAFLEMSKKKKLTEMIKAGIAGIQKRGKAEFGDKTLLDVWIPVEKFLLKDTLDENKITTAVDATIPLLAKKGRAEFAKEESIGHVDPGAVSSEYLFKALVKVKK